jgi:hypothetical protein
MKDLTMKIILVALAISMFATGTSQAAEPVVAKITLAARLTHEGVPVDGTVDLRLSLFAVDTGGTSLWSEDHAGVVATAGLANLALGETQPLDTVIFDGSARWLEIEVDGQRLSPRLPITSVPYALRAERAGQVGSLSESDIQRRISMTCPAGQTIASIGADGSAVCSGYTGASGVSVTGTQVAGDTSYLQRRVSNTCPAGQSIRAIAQDGAVTCEIDDNTTYTAGAGITISAANQIATDTNVVQSRVTGVCNGASAIGQILSNGTVSCRGIPTYTAGPGIILVNDQFSLFPSPGVTAQSTTTVEDVKDLGIHAFCALTTVQMQTGDTGNGKYCEVRQDSTTGHWSVVARGGGTTQALCTARCL